MNDESQKEKLRQHFARRVTTQARVVLDTWQKIHEDRDKASAHRNEFAAATDKLVRYAQRFEMVLARNPLHPFCTHSTIILHKFIPIFVIAGAWGGRETRPRVLA